MQLLVIAGRATKDGEVLKSKEGKQYAKFSVAVNEYYGKGEKKEEKVTFYNVLVFNKSSEKVDLIKKGDHLIVNGRPDVDAYLGNDGKAKASLSVFADKWTLVKASK